jgi:energy-coupling factor transporter ATP-binding protein EcfA2
MAMLRDLNRERGVTLIVVTHDPGVAAATDRVVRLSDGRVVSDDATVANGSGNGNGAGAPGRVWARLGELFERVRP